MKEEKAENKKKVSDEVEDIIEELRPFLNMDGGDVEFVSYDEKEKTVYVKLTGACLMCMSQDDTLENGLLEAIKDRIPEVDAIINTPL